jgi:hypothetical protein
MSITWTTTAQASADHGVKTLIYAEAGAGKTMLAASMPRPVVISAESGLLSLKRANIERVFGANMPHISYDIPVMQISTFAQFYEAYLWFANPANRAREFFSSIYIDSLTEIAEQILKSAKAANKDGRMAFGDLIEQTVYVVKLFRDLVGFNVGMTAKMEFQKDEAGLARFGPSMPGQKLGPALPYLFDEVFFLGVSPKAQDGSSFRYLLTRLTSSHIAKDRSGALDEWERPDLTHIINKIHGA